MWVEAIEGDACDGCLLMRFYSFDYCLLGLGFFKRVILSFLYFLGYGILLDINSNQITFKIRLSKGFKDSITVVFVKPFVKLNLLEICNFRG